MKRTLDSEHGIICRLLNETMGYFGWPSIAKMDDGILVVASSGHRSQHICPWGKTVLHFSTDEGKTWSDSFILNDSLIDDRDAGIISLGSRKLLVSWFTSDTREYQDREWIHSNMSTDEYDKMLATTASWEDEMVLSHLGSWIKLSSDGGISWGDAIRVPVTAPHGPIKLLNGHILYLGKERKATNYLNNLHSGPIKSVISEDGGLSWTEQGQIPIPNDTDYKNFHEPHAVELPSGKIIGMIRYQHSHDSKEYDHFSLFQTESLDGGKTWSLARYIGVLGSPPHLIRHSSGVIVCVYGYREEPFGQRAMLSYDDGVTWDADYILRDDGPDNDLGYPASVELSDGSILTIYYQKYSADEKPSLLWTRWNLPE